MEYIYSVMLLNKAGKTVDETNVSAVLEAAGVKADAAKVKSLIAALDGVDVEKVIAESSVVSTAAPAAAAAPVDAAAAPKKEEAPVVDASAGLAGLF
jgi:large subunit ribosomal protein L12